MNDFIVQQKDKPIQVCVYGASSSQIDHTYLNAGYQLGMDIAKRGWGLVFGAGDTGLMGAVVRGASFVKGYSTGISPRFFDKEGVLYQGCSEMLFTDTMRQRKQLMEEKSDAFIMTPGSIGTLEEFFEILVLRQLKQMNKPVCILNTNGFYDDLMGFLRQLVQKKFLSHDVLDLFYVNADPQKILDYIEKNV